MIRHLFGCLSYWLLPRDYVVLTINGISCALTPLDACDVLRGSDASSAYDVRAVRMTERAFENLGEHDGW